MKLKAALYTVGVLLFVASLIGTLFGVFFLADKLFGSPEGSVGLLIIFFSVVIFWGAYSDVLKYLEKKDAARIK